MRIYIYYAQSTSARHHQPIKQQNIDSGHEAHKAKAKA